MSDAGKVRKEYVGDDCVVSFGNFNLQLGW